LAPRSAATNRRLRSEAREKILSSSIRVFAAKGFHAASMDDVAASAGVSKGLAYNYFRSKEHLFAQALGDRIAHLFDIGSAVDGTKSPRERLNGLVAAALGHVRREPDVFRLYLSLSLEKSLAPVAKATLRSLRDPMDRYLEVIRAIFADAGSPDPDLDALAFRSAILGVLLRFVRSIEDLPAERVTGRLIDVFLPEKRKR
jgi:AcrR family transcriptional regulator